MKGRYKRKADLHISLEAVSRFAVLLGLAIYSFVSGSHGISLLWKTRSKVTQVANTNLKLMREIALKKDHVQRLQSDTATQQLDLERAGFTYQGATVFKIEARKPISPAAPNSGK